ncbi:MAG: alcohol dehydrogenase catalytic domain-containing protein [Candidatus Binatia bacterium]
MRQLTRSETGELDWKEVEAPRLRGAREALVQPRVVTLCDADRPIADGRLPVPGEIALGHEFVAEVVEVGEGVGRVRPGDVVIVPFQISCGECDRCRRGMTAHCRAVPMRSQYGFGPFGGDFGGAFSDCVRVPFADAMLVPLPAGVAPEAVACASDNLCDGFRAVVPTLRALPGADVLILGGIGSVPLYAVAFARACGAGRVDYLDGDRRRLEVAARLGARALEGPLPDAVGEYDLPVDGTLLEPSGLACALRSLRPHGVCVAVTNYLPGQDPHIPYFTMYGRGARLETGRVNARALMPEALELVQAGRVDPTAVSDSVLPFDDALESFLEPSLKPVFVHPRSKCPEALARGGERPQQ